VGNRAAAPLVLVCLISASVAAAGPSGNSATSHRSKPIPRISLAPFGPPETLTASDRYKATQPAVEGLLAPPRYIIGKDGTPMAGRRMTVSVRLGDTNIFAISGRFPVRQRAGATPTAQDQRLSGPTKLESGKIYGGGVERRLGPVDLVAQYQYSTISGDDLDPTSSAEARRILRIDDHSSSHSVKATVKLKF
jgi:hypothetical protein